MIPLRLKIHYYKPSGKHYGEGEVTLIVPRYEGTYIPNGYELRKKLTGMQEEGTNPGLMRGTGRKFLWVVTEFTPTSESFAPIVLPPVEEWK